MAIGENRYKNSTNLEPIANAVTSMGQQASKKDKPEILGQKIQAISTDATGTEGEMLAGKTFYAGGQKKTGSMANRGTWTNRLGINSKIVIPAGYHDGNGYVDQSIPIKGAQTYTPKTTAQTIGAGQYLSGIQTIAGDPNLKSENIVKGKTIFGVTGNAKPFPTDPFYIVKNGYFQNGFESTIYLSKYSGGVSSVGNNIQISNDGTHVKLTSEKYFVYSDYVFFFNKLVDFSSYSTLYIEIDKDIGSAYSKDVYGVTSYELISTYTSGIYGNFIAYGSAADTNNYLGSISVDLSKVPKNGYIAFYYRAGYPETAPRSHFIKNLYLVPTI